MTRESAEILIMMESLKQQSFKIQPWFAFSFWNNMKISDFAQSFIKSLINTIDTKDKLSKKNKNYLITILHIIILYNYNFQKDIIQRILYNSIDSKHPLVIHVIDYITKKMEHDPLDVSDLTIESEYELLNESVPLMQLFKIIHELYDDPSKKKFFFDNYEKKVFLNNSDRDCVFLIYILELVFTIFPGICENPDSILSMLTKYVTYPSPISNIACNVAKNIHEESKYPGSLLYKRILKSYQDFNTSDEGIIIFVDQDYKMLPSLLYHPYSGSYGISDSILDITDFLVKSHYKSNKTLSIEEVFKFASKISFNEKRLKIMAETFDLTDDGAIPSLDITMPFIQYIVLRIPNSLEIDYRFQMDIDQVKMVKNPAFDIFTHTIPKSYLCTNSLKIAIIGDDFLIGSALQIIYPLIIQYSIEFQILLIPYKSEYNLLSSFLTLIDPIYEKCVANLLEISTSILPDLDEESKAYVENIANDVESINTPWFSDPSPINMFHWGLQHFTLFADHAIDFFVWEAVLTTNNNLTFSVPFLASLHIGEQFYKTNGLPQAKVQNMIIRTDISEMKAKVSSLSVFNSRPVDGIYPNEPNLSMFWTTENIKLDANMRLYGQSSNMQNEVITGVYISSEKSSNLFTVLIDCRKFKNIKEISIRKLLDPKNENKQIVLKFCTFSPPILY